jgi:hypothetical protein
MNRFAGSLTVLLAATLYGLSGGCSGKGDEEKGNGDDAGVKVVEAKDLPKLGDAFPLLDGKRLTIAKPEKWGDTRRDGYLTVFYPPGDNAMGPPRMLVSAEAGDAKFETVTKENLEEFVAYVNSKNPEKTLREPVIPMIIGDTPFARFVKAGSFKGMGVHRQYLQTLQNGRLYTIELQVASGTLTKDTKEGYNYRDAAYAVAAGMKYQKPSAGGNDTPSDDGPAKGGGLFGGDQDEETDDSSGKKGLFDE